VFRGPALTGVFEEMGTAAAVATAVPRAGPFPRSGGLRPAMTYFTTSAVAMPNMPWGPSTCDRMWQWNAQTPG
jgi:hypothetical protein